MLLYCVVRGVRVQKAHYQTWMDSKLVNSLTFSCDIEQKEHSCLKVSVSLAVVFCNPPQVMQLGEEGAEVVLWETTVSIC